MYKYKFLIQFSLFNLIFLFCFFSFTQAETPPEVIANKISMSPKLDGKLDDVCWETATKIEGFHLFSGQKPGQKEPSEKTVAYIGYDNDFLYIAFKCFKSNIADIKAEIRERDGNVHHDDSVEIFLNSEAEKLNYYQFMVNNIGTKYDGFIKEYTRSEDKDWNREEWLAKSYVGKDYWSTEIAIPLHILKIGKEKVWRINLMRNDITPFREYISWAPIESKGGGWHWPEQFGYLKGLDIPDYTSLFISEINPGNFVAGENIFKIKLENTTKIPKQAEARIDIIGPVGESRIYSKKSLLNPESIGEIEVGYQVNKEGGYRYNLTLSHIPDGKSFYKFTSSLPIETSFMEIKLPQVFYEGEKMAAQAKLSLSASLLKKALIRLEVFKPDEEKPIATKEINNLFEETELIFPNLDACNYIASFKLLNEKVEVISSSRNEFRVIEGF